MDVEKQLRSLENSLKSLKASYPVAASKIKTYVQTSREFSVTGAEKPRFKFTPNYGRGQNQITTLRPVVTIDNNPVGYSPFVNSPQDGSGEVVIQIQFDPYVATTTYKVRIIASGTSPGSFSMLQ